MDIVKAVQDWNLGPGRSRPALGQEIFCNLPQFRPHQSRLPWSHFQNKLLGFLARWLRMRPHLNSKNSKLLEISPSCWPRHIPDQKSAIMAVTIYSRNMSLSIPQCYTCQWNFQPWLSDHQTPFSKRSFWMWGLHMRLVIREILGHNNWLRS